MSRFHRVDDIHDLTPSRFFLLANRLAHYGGAVAHRLLAQAQAAPAAPAALPAPSLPTPAGATVVPSTRAAISLSDLGPFISFGTG
jgi:hypothetical protein